MKALGWVNQQPAELFFSDRTHQIGLDLFLPITERIFERDWLSVALDGYLTEGELEYQVMGITLEDVISRGDPLSSSALTDVSLTIGGWFHTAFLKQCGAVGNQRFTAFKWPIGTK